MPRVLVTGGTGFIGTHLVAALIERGDRVRLLVRATSPAARVAALRRLGAETVEGDVSSGAGLERAVADVDTVYHLAGTTKSLRAVEFDAVNVRGVENVAAACAARTTPPVLLVVSSLAAAGPSDIDAPRTEDQPPRPVSRYGRSKRAGEVAAESWANRVPTSIVRPPIVLGERDRDCLTLFSTVARRGVHYLPGLRATRVSLVHAADLVDALVRVAERGQRLVAKGQAEASTGYYFAADPALPTYAQFGRMIGQAVGRDAVRTVRVPGPCLWIAGAASELAARVRRRPSIFNLDKYREATAGSWICSTGRIERELGFQPAAPMADRLRQTADWYRAEGWI